MQVATGLDENLGQMLDMITKIRGDLLSSLFVPVYSGAPDIDPMEVAAKRKKKKKKGQNQSMGLGM